MKLNGIKAIAKHLLLSESTVMDLITRQDLPAKKDPKTATWLADSADIERWAIGRGKEKSKPKAPAAAKKSPPPEAKAGKDTKLEKDGKRKVK